MSEHNEGRQSGENNASTGIAVNGHEGHDHDHDHDHDHGSTAGNRWKIYLPVAVSLVMLLLGILIDYRQPAFFTGPVRVVWFIAAYLPVGWPILHRAFRGIRRGDVFTEFTLMSLATLGAFAIGEYPEGVAVMVFYAIGELFQDAAVSRAKRSIQALLDVRPDTVNVLRNGHLEKVKASTIQVGESIQVKPGEKIALDGELLSEKGSFNTAALTGESQPDTRAKGDPVLAGMINLQSLIDVKVTTAYEDSKLSRILDLVQKATLRKAATQRFIARFAKIYTPIVVLLAALVVVVPYFLVQDYEFRDWLYRSLVFLVISCPCALVVSIPLGYFGGIGAGSRQGILFKGATFLDVMAGIDTVVMDKTGTMTEGVFKVQEVKTHNFDQTRLVALAAALESKSTHPVATAILQFAPPDWKNLAVENVEEVAGHGLKGRVDDRDILVGNANMMRKHGIAYDAATDAIPYTVVLVAIDGQYAGHLVIADQIKADALDAVNQLRARGLTVVMLSGDKTAVVQDVAQKLGIEQAFGDLLPEGKVEIVEALKRKGARLAFVGDGVNDAPVVALADAGIAMGGLGSDATIETADIVIQNDQPSKIPLAIRIGKATRRIVWQNITFAFLVKAIVMALGAGGLATMWEAVFADVGVALLAILNAVRLQGMRF